MEKSRKAYVDAAQREAFEKMGGFLKNPLALLLVVGGLGLAGMMITGTGVMEQASLQAIATPTYESGVLVATPAGTSSEENNTEQKFSPEYFFKETGTDNSDQNAQEQNNIQNTQQGNISETDIADCDGFPAQIHGRGNHFLIQRNIPRSFDNPNWSAWTNKNAETLEAALAICQQSSQ